MAIKVKFSQKDIDKYLEEAKDDAVVNVLEAIDMAFKQAMTYAKNVDTYKDQTGNLRASIGYVLYEDGREIKRDFYGAGAGTVQGENAAIKKATSLAGDNMIVGVLVAGMEYSAYVEAMGYDVITGASYTLIPEFKKYLDLVGQAYGIKFSFN